MLKLYIHVFRKDYRYKIKSKSCFYNSAKGGMLIIHINFCSRLIPSIQIFWITTFVIFLKILCFFYHGPLNSFESIFSFNTYFFLISLEIIAFLKIENCRIISTLIHFKINTNNCEHILDTSVCLLQFKSWSI